MHLLPLYRSLAQTASVAITILLIILSNQPLMAADIAAFGDSITEGNGSTTGGYPPKLEGLLNLYGETIHVVCIKINKEKVRSEFFTSNLVFK